ncbi:MAG TPA: hypothetical protein DEO82_05925 [Eubacterium sp.]|nr:hypothetical protein [Eubacterium sp.]
MAKANCQRGGCVDVFHASILKSAKYDGEYEFPVIREEHKIPSRLIPFSKAMKEKKDFHQWVCFYEDDFLFERIWNNPTRYIEQLSRFEGVITPDFSLYYDMPFSMQIWNIFRSRVIGSFLQSKGIRVIPNIRFGDVRTFECCCDGISKHSIIAIGTLGCIKVKTYRNLFEKGIEYVANRLEPETIVFYGVAPGNIMYLKSQGINVVLVKPVSFYGEVKR